MSIFYLTSKYHDVFDSMDMYYWYLYKGRLYNYSRTNKLEAGADQYIIILEDEKFETKILSILDENDKILVAGFNDSSFLNILDLDSLFEKLKCLLKDKYSDIPQVYTLKEKKENLKRFLTSHGNESLISDMNFIIYALNNYELYTHHYISYGDYNEKFLTPAIAKWEAFCGKINRFNSLIKMLGYTKNLDLILKTKNKIDPILTKKLITDPNTVDNIIKQVNIITENISTIADEAGIKCD